MTWDSEFAVTYTNPNMKNYFWSARMMVITALFMLYVPFVLNISVYQIGIESRTFLGLIFLGIGSIGTYCYLRKAKQALHGEAGEKYFGPQPDNTVLIVVLLISMGIAFIFFVLYGVMFMMTMNQNPPYPHKWNEIAHFWSLLIALPVSAVALVKMARIKK